MSCARLKFKFSIECYSATVWPIVTGFASSPFGMALYQLTKFHEKRLHGSARTAIFGGRRRRRKEEYKYNKGPSPLRGLLGPLNIAASSDKTGPSKKTMTNRKIYTNYP